MSKEDRARIIHGEVFYQNQWMPIKNKSESWSKNIDKIQNGLVYFQGEWITIEEKISRLAPKPERVIETTKNITFNQTINRQTYNINYNHDNRIIHDHDHKHVHLDEETFARYHQNQLATERGQHFPNDYPDKNQIPEKKNRRQKRIQNDTEYSRMLPHEEAYTKMLPHDEEYRKMLPQDKQYKKMLPHDKQYGKMLPHNKQYDKMLPDDERYTRLIEDKKDNPDSYFPKKD